MATDMSTELLVGLSRRRFGAIDIVRVTPHGTATTRAPMFDGLPLGRRSGWNVPVPVAVRRRLLGAEPSLRQAQG